jgi:hypothetical protein
MESVSVERLKEGATSWAELMPEAAFQELQHAARACLDANGMVYAEMSMQRAGKVVKVRFAGAVDPKVAGEPRTVTGLFRVALEACS